MYQVYQDWIIRDWTQRDRLGASQVIAQVLAEYGLNWEPEGADQDVIQVETAYFATGGEFWVVEQGEKLVGTAAYYPTTRGEKAVELRKMYLLPTARGQGLGKFLLQQLEGAIAQRGFQEIWLETATSLKEAVQLYETFGYQPATGVETPRCDRVYYKPL